MYAAHTALTKARKYKQLVGENSGTLGFSLWD